MWKRFLGLLMLAQAAQAASPNWQYVVGTGATPCASLLAADAAYAQALGTDSTTTHWFPLVVLTDGTCALRVVPGDLQLGTTITLPPSVKFPSGKTVSLAAAGGALNVALATRASLAGRLSDVLTLSEFESVLTSQQIAGLNALTSGPIFNYWTAVKAGTPVDVKDSTLQSVLAGLVAQGKLTEQQRVQLTTPQVVAKGP